MTTAHRVRQHALIAPSAGKWFTNALNGSTLSLILRLKNSTGELRSRALKRSPTDKNISSCNDEMTAMLKPIKLKDKAHLFFPNMLKPHRTLIRHGRHQEAP
ncbi:hypothetical protein [Phytohalomonas tamaricis]|uniref:hypothetical protein n=1 Tax=Phytohalomonas tamaricis TaxID=2081032 RepID=UPI000D0AC0A0|nr:hypothetical protein [Phytohalomonas tamaricis]